MSLDKPSISPEEALQFTQPTEGFLCSLAANTYGIEFFKFTIRDMDSNRVLFDIERERDELPAPGSLSPEMEVACRSIRYQFPPSFLRHRTVGAKLVFGVGPQPVPNFRMIERHYFRNVLVKSFDFAFGFCIPNSTNSWEAIYDMPVLSPEWEAAIIQNPFETRSDSFYFVNGLLVMHNKAEYAYCAPEPHDVALQQQQYAAQQYAQQQQEQQYQ
ncbi:GMP phosphodiesterase, delta subunit, putative [Bodo saltans]|uniref:GMP phosphodiesterase, delta subunit, putative n=1 Tax=Bodo saltans TaxID=75058 RepID=A0A0S4IN63_BODSA|nr:GMP phosphodiesterase, delta subunit, putative [Bodo saltans]|eukprot:CUE74245.1 GMP phosphodiesterase, delta subunit, putative [Bodo saltans]